MTKKEFFKQLWQYDNMNNYIRDLLWLENYGELKQAIKKRDAIKTSLINYDYEKFLFYDGQLEYWGNIFRYKDGDE